MPSVEALVLVDVPEGATGGRKGFVFSREGIRSIAEVHEALITRVRGRGFLRSSPVRNSRKLA
jgi:hypothetical protein